MNICGILFTRNESAIDRMTDSTVRHEVTHTKQIIEMGIIFYYLWYVIEWLIRLLIMADSHKAYRAISEKESRAAGLILITTERCFNIDGLITYNY